MRKYKIIVGTGNCPVKNLGGPGRFAPFLFNNFSEAGYENAEFIGLFCGVIVRSGEIVSYLGDSVIKNIGKSRQYEDVIDMFPNVSVALRKISSIVKGRSIRRMLNHEEVQCLHLHDYSIVEKLASIKTPIIFTNHYKGSLYKEYTQFRPGKKSPAFKKHFMGIERDAIDRADVITFPSISAMNLMINDFKSKESLIRAKGLVVYSGIDDIGVNPLQGRKVDGDFVLNIGNHIPDKDISNSLRIFMEIRKINDRIRFINIGSHGPETEKLKSLARQLKMEKYVDFKGIVSHEVVLDYLKSASMLLHTPKRVVFDLVILEAMSLSVPVISSKELGNVEALGEMHPLYVEGGEMKFDTASLFDPNFMKMVSFKQRARYLEKFKTETMLKRYYELYLDVIKGVREL